MKKYKWILSSILLGGIVFFMVSEKLENYYNHNRWKNKTSSEIKWMIERIVNNHHKEVLNLWNYYLVRNESYNYYLTICFMKKYLDEEKLFKKRVLDYENSENFNLKECPANPLQLIEDNNSFREKIEAQVLYQLSYFYNGVTFKIGK